METKSKLFVVLAVSLLVLPMTANAAVVYDDTFDATSLNSFWTLHDEAASYSGGGFAMTGDGWARFNNVGNYAYANIQPASTLDTTNGIRVDAAMRQDSYPTSTWGMGVSIYFDADNWVSIKQGAAGGQNGWMKDMMLNGVRSSQMSNTVATLRTYNLISSVELTATEIKFYGSSINPMVYHSSVTGADVDDPAKVSLINEFTMARPTGFTGLATIIIGKGYTGSGFPNPYFENSSTPDGAWYFAGIDYARITVIPEPATLLLLMGGAAAMLRRKR